MLSSTKSIFKQTSIYGFGNTFRKLSGVLILPLVKGYTTEEEFGVWLLLETIYIFTQILSSWGIKSGFTRWYNDMKSASGKKSLFFTAGTFNYISSTITVLGIGIIIYCFSVPILKYQVSENLIIAFTLSGLFKLFQEIPFIVLRLQHKAGKQTMHSSLNVLTLIILTFYFLEKDLFKYKEWKVKNS